MKITGILNAGIHEDTPRILAKKISLANGLALIIAFGVAGPFGTISLIHFEEIAYLPFAGLALCVSTIGINALGFHYVGRFILGLIPFTLTAIYGSYLAPAAELPLAPIFAIQIGFAVVPFILFDVSDKVYLIISGLFVMVSTTFFTKDLNVMFEKEIDITIVRDGYVFNIAIATAIMVACGSILYMSYNNYRANREQEALLKQMDARNEELEKSEETLRENLKKVEENQAEENKRNWASAGLARFGNLLRSNDDSDSLFDQLISGVTEYIEANQSALFLVNRTDDKNISIDMQACYAYSRKKHLEKSISPGQGLIGQAYHEKDVIHLTEVPDNYVTITSGLGEALPKAILIVPLMVNEEVEGFFEIASFNDFEPHTIEFLQNLGENVASFIGMNRINTRTKLLLQETQQQAEEMKSQEEEMRQNMEELQATHEEMNRKEKEYIARLEQLENELRMVREEKMNEVVGSNPG